MQLILRFVSIALIGSLLNGLTLPPSAWASEFAGSSLLTPILPACDAIPPTPLWFERTFERIKRASSWVRETGADLLRAPASVSLALPDGGAMGWPKGMRIDDLNQKDSFPARQGGPPGDLDREEKNNGRDIPQLLLWGMTVAASIATIMAAFSSSTAQRSRFLNGLLARERALQQELIYQLGLFSKPITAGQHTLHLSFAEATVATARQIAILRLRSDIEVDMKGKLPPLESDRLQRHLVPNMKEIQSSWEFVKSNFEKIRTNPWTVVARDENGDMVGFVFIGLVYAADDTKLSRTWEGLSSMHLNNLEADLPLNRMVIFLFTGIDTPVREAMIASSMEVWRALRAAKDPHHPIDRIINAYSNPHAKLWHDMDIHAYLARVMAHFIVSPLIVRLKEGELISRDALHSHIRNTMRLRVSNQFAGEYTGRILAALDQLAGSGGFPDTPPRLMRFLEIFRSTYGIRDPALSFYLEHGANLRRPIADAFTDGTADGYACIMEYLMEDEASHLPRRPGTPPLVVRWGIMTTLITWIRNLLGSFARNRVIEPARAPLLEAA